MRWWLSFCDASKPAGSQFLGACIVSAEDVADACRESWLLNINPGGEVAALAIDPAIFIAEKWLGRLLNRDECAEMDRELQR
jgi:hypothetical protein